MEENEFRRSISSSDVRSGLRTMLALNVPNEEVVVRVDYAHMYNNNLTRFLFSVASEMINLA